MDINKNKRLLNFGIYSHLEPNQKQFNNETTFLSELFYRLLKKYKYQSQYNYISFGFGREADEMKGSNTYRKVYCMDLSEFHKIEIGERKWMIFEIVYKGLTLMTNDKTSLNVLSNIHEECTKNGLRNEWYLNDKLFRSPDRKKYIGIWCVWKEEVQMFIHIYDKDKKTLLHQDSFIQLPSFAGDYIYNLKPRWIDPNKFNIHYSDGEVINGSKKIGDIEVFV